MSDSESTPSPSTSTNPKPYPTVGSSQVKNGRIPTILITGASAGIGKDTAVSIAKNFTQVRLVLWSRRQQLIDEYAKALGDHVQVVSASVDVRDSNAIEAAVKTIPDDWLPLSGMILNAGLALGTNTLAETPGEDINVMFDTNVKGVINVYKTFVKDMQAAKNGHVIFVSSISGTMVYPGGSIYCSTKWSVEALAKTARYELLPSGVKVTSIKPGLVDTEFSTVRFKGDTEKAKTPYNKMIPLYGRDIAESIVWCLKLPDHVSISDLTIEPKCQSGLMIHRE